MNHNFSNFVGPSLSPPYPADDIVLMYRTVKLSWLRGRPMNEKKKKESWVNPELGTPNKDKSRFNFENMKLGAPGKFSTY